LEKTVIGAAALFFSTTLLGAILSFGVQVLLARLLGVSQFGIFASSMAIVVLVAPMAGFGVAGFWLKLYGQEGWAAQRWLPASLSYVFASTSLVIVALVTWAWLGPNDRLTANVLTLLSVTIIGSVALDLVSVKFQLEDNYRGLALSQALLHALRFAGIGILALFIEVERFDALIAAQVFVAAACALSILSVWQLSKMVRGKYVLHGHTLKTTNHSGRPSLANTPKLSNVAQCAWPYGLAGVFYLIYFQSDIILVKYMVSESAAGLYNVAFVVMLAVYLFPSVFYQKLLLPKLHRWAYHDVSKLKTVHRHGTFYMALLGVVAMVVIWGFAPLVVPRVFGNDYEDAVLLLMVLSLATPFRFVALSADAVLTTQHFIASKVRFMGIAALANVVLNLILIPIYGSVGAAIATVATEAFLAVVFICILRVAQNSQNSLVKN
jgi:hypothetical protein